MDGLDSCCIMPTSNIRTPFFLITCPVGLNFPSDGSNNVSVPRRSETIQKARSMALSVIIGAYIKISWPKDDAFYGVRVVECSTHGDSMLVYDGAGVQSAINMRQPRDVFERSHEDLGCIR